MIYRIILTALVLIGFALDYHFAPGGTKLIFDSFTIFTFILSFLFMTSWIVFWDVTFPKGARLLNSLFVGLMTLIHYYELNTGGTLDAAVMLDNWRGIADPQGLRLLAGLLHDNFVAANVFWSVLIGFFFFATYWEKSSKLKSLAVQSKLWLNPVPFVLLFVLTFFLHTSFENYVGVFRSLVLRLYTPPNPFEKWNAEAKKALEGQFVQTHFKSDKAPNIVLVFIESLSSYFVETKSPSGIEYMPYLNSLIQKGYYFEKHYSVSVQTVRGQFAALCGKMPIFQGLESFDYRDHNFDCLPQYLKKLRYKSIFMQAFGKANFDNTHDFFLTQGFDEIPQVAFTCDKELSVPCWNWGIQDDEFYRRAFKKIENEKSPLFLTLATITSHMPFTGTPEKMIVHYKNPRNRFENYANTLTVVDESLKVLMSELKRSGLAENTVLVITGDHGFPMGQHGNFHNENYAYEENFRVPLLILDLRKPFQGRRFTWPTSHMSLPATLLDIAGYSGPTSFQKPSLYSSNELLQDQPVYLIQPYSGVMLGSVRWPWKFLYEQRSHREWVYNLETDPGETKILKRSDLPKNYLEKMELDLATILMANKKDRQRN